jgi:long-chain acyl-CoA synthetase
MSARAAVRQPVEDDFVLPQTQRPSLLYGPTDPPLVDLTLGELLNLQCLHHGTREGIVISWTGARWTYNELNHHSRLLAAALLEMGIGAGDRVGIMAGNCEQYAAVFFAVTRIGAILVILNNTYTPTEAQYGLDFSGMPCYSPFVAATMIPNQPVQSARCSSPPRRSADSTRHRYSHSSRQGPNHRGS